MYGFTEGLYKVRSTGTVYRFFHSQIRQADRTFKAAFMAKCLTGINKNNEPFPLTTEQLRRAVLAKTYTPFKNDKVKTLHRRKLPASCICKETLHITPKVTDGQKAKGVKENSTGKESKANSTCKPKTRKRTNNV